MIQQGLKVMMMGAFVALIWDEMMESH